MNILFIGDICGIAGVDYLIEKINFLKKTYKTDIIIVNAENASNGKGLDYKNYQNLILAGVDIITMGNHTWSNKELSKFIDQTNIIRPFNFEKNYPGKGYQIIKKRKKKILIMNILGRIFMENHNLLCPFKEVEKILKICKNKYDYSLLDFHAQATSEKMALAYHFDGKIDAILGTHTHIQTNDERVLPKNTLYISDVGMTGSSEGIIGSDKSIIINNFLNNKKKIKQKIAEGKRQLNGVFLNLGKIKQIIKIKFNE
ncbi:TIGR00282 family metallophosphoesterase [Candidatus Phytoplasma sacchari]|uniref:TIGR00282 family metallophosphoesterase n=1 Tax=Candidatus Phytoplasma sacchari TaxID=2609813 RepID=A0ABY7M1J8_9MOLU|nr:TIGR00282 family metallophosphoesterase [Candidatus Phytoplasma sacchari]KAB8122647.1 TIGR00282 family metallophosphoesterase [Candidatus Phytoplasma sacchari]WBL31524.1 TIGR00282 family metallophosphoesterase [Candidatus Phytoplasma sacchari]